jgi:acyl-CoA synthetase (AMP-forming)/AMP-acid ligase II
MAAMRREEAVAELTRPGAPFEIVETEVGGVPVRVYAGAPPTLREVLASSRAHGARDFLVYEDERWTFAEHLEIVAGLAHWLADERGIGRGDRVAIGMRNFPEWLMAFWATQALGAVAVPLNAWWTAPELRFALEDSGAALAVLDGERHDRLADALVELRLPTIVVRHDGDLRGPSVHWGAVLEALDRTADLPASAAGPDDDATIIYTSGTTGRPKGAVGTHRNHVHNYLNMAFGGAVDRLLAASAAPAPTAAPPVPCMLQTYPFFHIGGITTICTSTGFGVKTVLQYKWDLEEALAIVERERVTSLAAVPTILRRLLESPLLERYDVSSLSTLGSGGAPVPPDLIPRIDEQFASQVAPSNGYGLTETTSAVTGNRGRDYVARPNSVGRMLITTDVRVVDPDTGVDVAPGATGELWFRGPTVVRGYWNQPEATALAFTDGWFHSGDLGTVDDEGFVYVVDRLKDVVIRSGENVYCVEVESALFEHPAVADVAVIGVPHRELGEQVAAVVQVHVVAEVTAAELQEHVAARLARFKVPEVVVFREDALPRTATGKVLKRDLRDELL